MGKRVSDRFIGARAIMLVTYSWAQQTGAGLLGYSRKSSVPLKGFSGPGQARLAGWAAVQLTG